MSQSVSKRATWPTTREESDRLRAYKAINLERAARNPNENWMAAYLASTGLKWTRQAVWGFCIFDFWCAAKGIAVEVDGPEHQARWDAFRDQQNLARSGIIVLRVRNRNEKDAARALGEIAASGSWNSRRMTLGLKAIKGQPDEYGASTPPAHEPQPRCSECSTRIRTRRPDGAVRCRCGKSVTEARR